MRRPSHYAAPPRRCSSGPRRRCGAARSWHRPSSAPPSSRRGHRTHLARLATLAQLAIRNAAGRPRRALSRPRPAAADLRPGLGLLRPVFVEGASAPPSFARRDRCPRCSRSIPAGDAARWRAGAQRPPAGETGAALDAVQLPCVPVRGAEQIAAFVCLGPKHSGNSTLRRVAWSPRSRSSPAPFSARDPADLLSAAASPPAPCLLPGALRWARAGRGDPAARARVSVFFVDIRVYTRSPIRSPRDLSGGQPTPTRCRASLANSAGRGGVPRAWLRRCRLRTAPARMRGGGAGARGGRGVPRLASRWRRPALRGVGIATASLVGHIHSATA